MQVQARSDEKGEALGMVCRVSQAPPSWHYPPSQGSGTAAWSLHEMSSI